MNLEKNFSIWSSFDIDLSPEDMVDALERRGMHVCEFSDEHAAELLKRDGTPEEIGVTFRNYAAARGVTFPQGHLWLQVSLCDGKEDTIPVMKKWLRLFGAIGIKNAVLHADGHSFPEGTDSKTMITANAAVLRELLPTAKETGVRICLENLINNFASIEELLALREAAGAGDEVGICLDTGHLNIAATDSQIDFIRKAGKLLHALHIADNEGERDQHMMPFGKGNVDFCSMMPVLKEIGYDELFNYEIPGERKLPQVLRDAKTAYLREMTTYLFSLMV